MDSYLLAVFVTLEQEIAIQELFAGQGWLLKKYEGYGGPTAATSCNLHTGAATTTEANTGNVGKQCCDLNRQPFHGDSCNLDEDNSTHANLDGEWENKSSDNEHSISSGDDTKSAKENEIFSHLTKIMEDSLKSESVNSINYDNAKSENDFICSLLTVTNSPENERAEQEDISELLIRRSDSQDETVAMELEKPKRCNGENISTNFASNTKTRKTVKTEVSSKLLSADVRLRKRRRLMDKEHQSNEQADETKKANKKLMQIGENKNKKIGSGKEKVEKETPVKRKDNRPKTTSKTKQKTGSFHCNECNYTFRLLGPFNNHKRDGKCMFECKYCGKKFTSRYYSNYLSHLKYHIKERPHECDVCHKTYIEAQALKIHLRKHTGDRPFICDLCGKRFYASSHLVCHKNNTHKESEEVHQCDLCGAVLSTVGNLRVHKKVVHTIDRPFTCEICGKTFKTKKSLEQVHAKVHNEIYPFVCEFSGCGKAFKRGEGLSDHVKRHNNQRTHFCERCGKGFYSNKDLLLHTRTHTGEKPFACQLCGYKCALAGNLRKHMKTHQ